MNVFLTGATGFLGSHLLPELTGKGFKVTCLLRPQKGKSASARLRQSLEVACLDQAAADHVFSKLTIVEGDMVRENFGLEEKIYCSLKDETDRILHCAAMTGFSPDIAAEQWKNNVEATENLARFALAGKGVEGFHYVSTAYVAGDREGIVYEDELDVGQGFYNGYEKSKCFAEKMLHKYSSEKGLNLTVYRPAIIVGDSNTGRTILFNGMYMFMRFLQVAKQSFSETDEEGRVIIPARIIGNPATTKNFVPIDYVVDMMTAIFMCPAAHGKTYHITNDHPPTLRLIQEVIEDILGITATQCVDEDAFRKKPPTDLESLFGEQIKMYAPYLLKEPLFDRRTINAVIPQDDCPQCTSMDRAALKKLFDYALASKWGRKKVA